DRGSQAAAGDRLHRPDAEFVRDVADRSCRGVEMDGRRRLVADAVVQRAAAVRAATRVSGPGEEGEGVRAALRRIRALARQLRAVLAVAHWPLVQLPVDEQALADAGVVVAVLLGLPGHRVRGSGEAVPVRVEPLADVARAGARGEQPVELRAQLGDA